jgi:hypothetical protein
MAPMKPAMSTTGRAQSEAFCEGFGGVAYGVKGFHCFLGAFFS